jgi:hypothetical protein
MRLRTKIRIAISDFVRCINTMGNLIVINKRNIRKNQNRDHILEEEKCLENEINNTRICSTDYHEDMNTENTEDEVKLNTIKENNCFCPLMSLLFYDCKAAAALKSSKCYKVNDNSRFLESGEHLHIDNHDITAKETRLHESHSIRNSTSRKHSSLPQTSDKINDCRDGVVYGDDDTVHEDKDYNRSYNSLRQYDESIKLSGLLPTFWDLILSLYLPFLIQSIFGTFYVARSVVFNYGIPYYIVHVIVMIASKVITSSKLQKLVTTMAYFQKQRHPECDELTKASTLSTEGATSFSPITSTTDSSTTAVMGMMAHNNKGSPTFGCRLWNSCNPPSLIAFLSIITIAAMVVHPDGYTWIIVRKLR